MARVIDGVPESRDEPCPRRPDQAFTLIELLLVLAIILVLVGLLLPALNDAREAARRLQCSNNLHQLGLALQNYASHHGVLPPGVVDAGAAVQNSPTGYHFGWVVQVLPFLDQKDLFNQFNFYTSVYDASNQTMRALRLNLLHCPDDSTQGFNITTSVALSSYAGCHHDVEAPIDFDNHGVFFLNSRVHLQDVTDGLAHTLFVGEVARAHALGWASGTRATLRNTGHRINRLNLSGPGITQVPPTTVGAAEDPSTIEEMIESVLIGVSPTFVGGFGSQHSPDGANFAFGDGSVRFLRSAMEMSAYQRLGHRSDGEPIDDEAY